jgi:hypothetical protein
MTSLLLSLPLSSRSGSSNFACWDCDLADADGTALAACGVKPDSDDVLRWPVCPALLAQV